MAEFSRKALVVVLVASLTGSLIFAYAASIGPRDIAGFLWVNSTLGMDTPNVYVRGNNVTALSLYPQQPASYIIWTDGSTYYAKNGTTGLVTNNANIVTLLDSIKVANVHYHFNRGEYLFSSTHYPLANVTISGEGKATVLKIANGANLASGIFRNTAGATGLTIKDLVMHGNGDLQTGTSVLIYLRDIDGVKILGVNFIHGHDTAIKAYSLDPVDNVIINKCLFYDIPDYGIWDGHANPIKNWKITENTFENVAVEIASRRIIFLQTADNIDVSNNIFNNVGDIRIQNSKSVTISHNTIIDGNMNYAFAGVISVINTDTTLKKDISIIGNTITWTQNPTQTANGIVVSTEASTIDPSLIDVSITGNTINGGGFANVNAGIYLHGKTTAATLENVKRVSITGNAVSNITVGIILTRSEGIAVDGNVIDGSTKAIQISSSFNSTVSDNILLSAGIGISEEALSDYNRLYDNDLRGCVTPFALVGANTITRDNEGYTEYGDLQIAGTDLQMYNGTAWITIGSW